MYNICIVAPVVFRTENLKYVVYPKDHKPAHVHVIGPDAEAVFDIKALKIISNYGFSEKTIRKILKYLKERQESLMEVWNDYQK